MSFLALLLRTETVLFDSPTLAPQIWLPDGACFFVIFSDLRCILKILLALVRGLHAKLQNFQAESKFFCIAWEAMVQIFDELTLKWP